MTAVESSRWPTSPCKGCGALVVWAVTAALKPMPVDPEPAPGGNVLLRPWPGRDEPEAQVVANPARLFGKTAHLSHFVTCANADEFRRPRQPRRSS